MTKVNDKSTTQNELGGKAHGLNVLSQLGYNVPEYLVVPFSDDINASELQDTVNKFIAKYSRIAVRSSANIEDGMKTSFAGQFNSYLNISADEVFDRIEDVRNSIKSEHVKRYCEIMDLSVDEIKMNVIIQQFEEPSCGGVWMGKGALGGRLEWVEGRGDKVVNGNTTPFYEVYDESGLLLNKSIKPVLTDKFGKSLAEVCKEIQSKVGFEADLEFCICQGEIQWLQLRRVTRVTGNTTTDDESLDLDNVIKGEAASPYVAKGITYRLDHKQSSQWGSGNILVAMATSPNDMMYIMTSEGVVTKMGGMLSHAAVVCRELGKACVVGVDIDKIQHGTEVQVNGKTGEIHLL